MLTIVSWDGYAINDGTNYLAGFSPGMEWGLPDVGVRSVPRLGAWPVLATIAREGRELSLYVSIANAANVRALRAQLLRWFDPEDETPKRLIIRDSDGVTERYVLAICQAVRPVLIGDVAACGLFRVSLAVHGDVRWRSVVAAGDVWDVTASGQTRVIANGGADEAYPVITFEPTSAKTGGYNYRRWLPVVWRSTNAANGYPVMAALDTAALVLAGKMQADGDDLRVQVDGLEVNRWLYNMNAAATHVWLNLNFTAAPVLTLRTAFAAGDIVTSLDLDNAVEMALLPATGTVLIDSEAFAYTGRDLLNRQLTGVTRAAKGTAAAGHTAATTVRWIQRDVYLLYGNATATAPATDDRYAPAFWLTASTNTLWVYNGEFGDSGNLRTGRWTPDGAIGVSSDAGCYTGRHRTLADPYSVIGAWQAWDSTGGRGWNLVHPCGIVNAEWYGEQIAVNDGGSSRPPYVSCTLWYFLTTGWTLAATVAQPSVADVYEAWTQPLAVPGWSRAYKIGFTLAAGYHSGLEVNLIDVHLDASTTPLALVGAEVGAHSLAATLTNETSGAALTATFTMATGTELEVDTDRRTVTYLADGSRQFQAVSLSTARRHWLPLVPGNNTLRFDDVGTNAVTVTLAWEERNY